ncbi:MAG: AbrB/MazE/SpoVT family DNA-binding domain-containing protein [Synergistaceae bacterium]|jgi:AbrB family looped-hinge helix DNA binding protein|nr:AbrB/MazE/SpoVT family DNA-binding domain-containing protein [Synergistaceae bacterium]
MREIMTVSTKGQITLPIDIREQFNIIAGDKVFGEVTDEGFLIRKPQKSLLDYKGFIKAKYDPNDDRQIAMEGMAAHVLGEE